MEILGIKFAPLNIPVERRIQTGMALFWVVSLVFGGFAGAFLLFYILFWTKYYLLGLLYIIWMIYDRHTPINGGRRAKMVRNFPGWSYFIDFFPMRLKKTADLPPSRNYMFSVFPHGLLSAGAFGHFGTDRSNFRQLFPGLTPYNATLDMHFSTPFFREYLLSLGAISSSKQSLINILSSEEKGKVMILVVGGAAESLYAHPGSYRIVLKNRKGFVRIALATGCPLVPVFSFGETDLYEQVSNPPGSKLLMFQNWLRKYTGLAPCLFIGRGILQYSFGPLPRRCPITTVVGSPIELPKVENPTQELVDKYHSIFIKNLIELFEDHKHKYVANPESTELLIE